MTAPVEKLGSLWKGQITAVAAAGHLITNFQSADIAPLAEKSKAWFDIGVASTTIRGLLPSAEGAPSGKLVAVQGKEGWVEIHLPGGSAADVTHLTPGAPVSVQFRT